MNKLPRRWEFKEIGELLDYEQPTRYIVKNDYYDNKYNIPVLTAGKSFILGYTNEKEDIYWNLPVIIFDDFTTASKYVDFPFKVKSSAMKILKAKENISLKLIYEIMQLINFSPLQHQRHWISIYSKIKILIPKSLKEQQKIAEILSEVDKNIEITKKIIEKEKKIKKGLMQDLLKYGIDETGNIRNPNTHKFKKSELGLIPEKWEIKKIEEIAEYLTDGDWIESKDLSLKGIRLIQTGDIDIGILKPNKNKKFISFETFKKLKCKLVKKNDILICRLAEPVGRSCIYNEDKMAIVAVDITIFRLKRKYDIYFLNYILNQPFILKKMENLSGGSTRIRISKNNLIKIKIPLPSLKEEQQKIAEILSAQDEKIENLNKKLNKLKKIKKALMQDLLTGKIRVTKLLKDKK